MSFFFFFFFANSVISVQFQGLHLVIFSVVFSCLYVCLVIFDGCYTLNFVFWGAGFCHIPLGSFGPI